MALHLSQFRDAFHLLDHDKDGAITDTDLRQTLTSLGMSPSQPTIDALLAPSSTGINVAMFITLMSERLSQFDSESDLVHAFESFDEGDTGTIKADDLRRWMADVGERMDQHEIDKFLNGSFTDRHGNFNYREWIKVLRVDDQTKHAS